ncbi:regulator of G-protein signaling 2 [Oreochromis niloticus]|uniref:Regulator of G protein signaling 2 n=2 Tax=Oreochromis TaxID=8139 RepID=A0A669EII7_ORENI|nr:regulator of G-protein signaling 2 [Oreochromis niloticus]XP_031613618.1 regulator of G-protein signaling 2-like [Oreochromis aureus]
MRENLTSVSSPNMAFTDCMKPTELAADKEIKRKNWRNRIRLLLKTNSTQRVKNRLCRPNVDDVNQWAQSLDKLLSHKYGKIAFCIFLRSEFCDENIEFWSACEEFKKIKSRKEMASKANRIYEEFIKSEAPKEVNLDFQTKNAIAQSLHKPTATSFLVAQRKIYNLMENNSYPRFISSDLYKELYAAAAREDMDVKS